MSDVIRIIGTDRNEHSTPLPLPLPRPTMDDAPITIRPAGLGDYDFIDDLQKRHKDGVGFMWEAAIKGHIQKSNVLIAEAETGQRAGYVLGVDRYLKRDELGIIYQMNVAPEYQRSLVAANLLKAKFERSAYGCRLYCCWCAQDLAANRFWEAMGFVPLAFRTGGGRKKGFDNDGRYRGRVHIFWQKRIREGDTGDVANGGTAYWFPSITGAGAIGEDRIVLPIPPGTHWSDAKPIVLPEGPRNHEGEDEVKLLESEVQRLERERKQAVKKKKAAAVDRAVAQQAIEAGGLRFGVSPTVTQAAQQAEAEVAAELKAAKRSVKQAKKKFDPAQEAFTRELKDRWLEQVLAEPQLLASGGEKYNVSRQIEGTGYKTREPGSARDNLQSDALKKLDAA